MSRYNLFTALLTCILLTNVLAQTNSGRLVGTISDASGVIPGATIIVTDNKTGKERTVVAGEDGAFTVPQLEFGTYTVKISAPNHKTFTAKDVKIDAGREYTLNAALDVGNISEEVTVVAGADVINGSNGELSTSVSSRQIQELPLNGRNPVALVQLQAGTASNSANSTSINGQRPSATNITRDGLNIQDNFIRANASDFTQQTPTTDDVAEFTITTQNAGADSGYGSSQVSLVTPRGQADFHGSLFEYNRNSKFGANTFFSNATNTPRAFRNFNQYGGKVGGPVWKSRGLFFFAEFEKTSDRQSGGFTRTVLTPSARQGIFTYVDGSNNIRQTNLFALGVTNPASAPPNSPPPPTSINPIIQTRFLANIPLGNTNAVGDGRNTTGYFFRQLANDDRKSFTTRIDWDVNEKNSLNAVYNIARQTQLRPDFGDANGFNSFPQATQSSPVDFYVLAWRSTLTPNFTNEVRAGLLKAFPAFPETYERQSFLLSNGATVAGSMLSGLITSPEPTYRDQGRNTKNWGFKDNADYLWGNHSLRFGGEVNLFRVVRLNSGGAIPQYNLGVASQTPQITTTIFEDTSPGRFPGGISVNQRATANALYALLGGIVNGGQQTFNVADAQSGFVPGIGFAQNYAYENYSFYFADQWRFRPNLTLNLGLRYEVYPSNRELNGVISEPIIPPGTDVRSALLDPNGGLQTAGENVGGGRLFNTDFNNFAPVLSVAYSPEFKNKFLRKLFPGEGRTVFRGGYRVSYFSDEFLKASSAEGDSNSGKRQNAVLGGLNDRPESLTPFPTPPVVIPRTFAQNAAFGNTGMGNFPPTVLGVDPNLQTASNNEYSLSIQREIGFNTAIEIRYVGAYSANSTRFHDLNQIDVTNNGFLPSFLQAQNNANASAAFRAQQIAAGVPAATATTVSGAYNPGVPGSVQVTGPLAGGPNGLVLTGSGSLSNATVVGFLQQGLVGSLAQQYVSFGLTGPVRFLLNPNAGVVGLLDNSARYNHNALQFEVRRRFSGDLYFQTNYTFSKTLANAPGTDQRRQEFELDANRPELEYSRVDYDQTHIFNVNAIYELPFGKNKRFFADVGSLIDKFVGGWQLNGLARVASGTPFSIVDPRGVLNRPVGVLVARNPAVSALTTDEIRDLIGIFRTSDGSISLINPSVIDPNTRRLSNGPTSASFSGQAFFNVPAGQIGNIERNAFDGPGYFNIDASLFKNIRITERVRFQIRAEAFNLLNRTNFSIPAGTQQRSINAAGGFNITTTYAPRVVQFAARFEF